MGWRQKFQAAKMSSTAAIAMGTAALAALTPGTAHAIIASGPITSPGGPSPSDATDIGELTTLSSIVVDQPSLPAYWEFTWGAGPDAINVDATVGSFDGNTFLGFFTGDLELYQLEAGSFVEIDSAPFEVGSFVGVGLDTAEISNVSLAASTEYVVGIDGSFDEPTDPPITVNFNPAAAVPEPASIGLLGGALAAFGIIRRRRKQTS